MGAGERVLNWVGLLQQGHALTLRDGDRRAAAHLGVTLALFVREQGWFVRAETFLVDSLAVFEALLGPGPVTSIELPGFPVPLLLVRFPAGGSLSIEFTDDAPDDDKPRLGAWLELRAPDPAAALRAALDAGMPRVRHPGHPYYFMAPGGQVFTIAPSSSQLGALRS